MPHFFINSKDIKDTNIILKDKETLCHLFSSLRIKKGEKVKFIDENEIQYETAVCDISKNELCAKIETSYKSKRKLPFELCLVQSVLKPDAQTLALSNAAQCGVSKIYPVISDNCTLNLKSIEGKKEKWQKIANEAAKQCERANFAHVEDVSTLSDVLLGFRKENILIYAEKFAKYSVQSALTDIDRNSPIAVVIGPEGGFSNMEFQYFIHNDYKLLSLGDLIFKAPNAITAGISNIVTRLL